MEARSVAAVHGSRSAASVCLTIAVGVSAVLWLRLVSELTFLRDEFELLLVRRGSSVGDFLDPWHENILLGPTAVYKLVLATFGMSSALPFFVVSISVFLFSAVLLFVYLRPRVGDWAALLAAILILFLGAAFEDLLYAFQVGFFGSVAAGLGMLIALDRDDSRGDVVACGLLVISIAFSSIGLAFAVGALADLALGSRPRAARAYVALLPLALYGLWWLGWGHTDESHFSPENLVHVPEYVFDAAAAGVISLLGLATGDGSEPEQPHLIWGKTLVVGAVALAAFQLARGERPSRNLVIVLAIALAFWVLPALDRSVERFPTSSRYQYPSAVFLLLIAGEALRGRRIPSLALFVGALVTGAAVFGGLSLMQNEYEDRWRPNSDSLRSSLAAIEIGGESVDPDYVVSFGTVNVSPKTYFSAVEADGSPAYSESELAGRPETERALADSTLVSAIGITLAHGDPARATVGCQTVQASASVFTDVTLLRGAFTLTNQGDADAGVLLGRFSDGLSVDLGPLSPGSSASLVIPVDKSTRPWRLGLAGDGPVRLCSTAPE